MIQFKEQIAWVRGTDGRSRPFDGVRLTASLQSVLPDDGNADQTLIVSIVSAVHQYLCEASPAQATSSTDIEDMVFGLLTMLGLDEIARAYMLRGQRTRINLDSIAATQGFELGFYQRLAAELHAVADEELEFVQLSGLRACVMRLCGAKRWGASCRTLADEIVGFVRVRVERVRPRPAAALCVEVTE